ncbi:Holliday junction resolvase MOC1, chloroplastic-like [Panicum hallii]|uniref:Holliday junction resolvase MOC1, chloroplastic-like n=1 Tax=Panicum hallii TaxID=206008 RepID=UPI000DF4E4E8|nr:Holliday junction resolvase MOC1, chloroplastic-like [Panicum hallii]
MFLPPRAALLSPAPAKPHQAPLLDSLWLLCHRAHTPGARHSRPSRAPSHAWATCAPPAERPRASLRTYGRPACARPAWARLLPRAAPAPSWARSPARSTRAAPLAPACATASWAAPPPAMPARAPGSCGRASAHRRPAAAARTSSTSSAPDLDRERGRDRRKMHRQ